MSHKGADAEFNEPHPLQVHALKTHQCRTVWTFPEDQTGAAWTQAAGRPQLHIALFVLEWLAQFNEKIAIQVRTPLPELNWMIFFPPFLHPSTRQIQTLCGDFAVAAYQAKHWQLKRCLAEERRFAGPQLVQGPFDLHRAHGERL